MPQNSTQPMLHMYLSRRRIDLSKLTVDDITIEDIAHNLAILPRFVGNTSRPISVAEHSILVMQMVEEAGASPIVMLQALLHDATEAYMGDIPAPVKAMVPEIRHFEQDYLWPVIAEKFGLPLEMDRLIKRADWTAFYVEAHSLCYAETLHEWEHYDEYFPAATAWMEAYGEMDPSEMPHPGMTHRVFLNCFNTLKAAVDQGMDSVEVSDPEPAKPSNVVSIN